MSNSRSTPKRIVLTTFGSLGDLHPYLALAVELKSRGHHPVIATSEAYREKTEALGIAFHSVRPQLPDIDDPGALELLARIMDVERGAECLVKEVLIPALRGAYEDLGVAIRSADMLVTHPIVFAGPLLAQKTNIPWVSTVLAPYLLWSDHEPKVVANASWLHPMLRLGGPVVSRVFRKLAEAMTNPWMKPLYEFRQELGLTRGGHPVFEGQYSPQLNLALFSKVLSERQPDWPTNTHITGFPFYDRPDNAAAASELLKFLDEGESPIVFTLGSSAVHIAGDFFEESIKAARMLDRRAVLLVGKDEHKPNKLPDGMAAFAYAPHGELFPRASCIVHQGGVGTTGQGLRAGVPTLIVPFSLDQPDNAARTVRIGAGRTLSRERYKAVHIAEELKELLENPTYAARAKAIGEDVRAEQGARTAVDLMLETLR